MPGAAKNNVPVLPSAPDKRLPCVKRYYQSMDHEKVIPWWLFIMFCLVPVAVLFSKIGKSYLQSERKKGYKLRKSEQAIDIAESLLKKIKRKNELQRIYTVFIGLFADKWQMPLSLISDQFIVERLKQSNLDEQQLGQWQKFISQAAELAYGGKGTNEQVEQLFKQAEKWLDILKQVL